MAVYKDKNKSTWYVSKRYTDWDGSKKRLFKRGFQTKREALEYELSFVSKISDNQKMLFKDFIPIYYEDMEKRVRKNTMITKKNIIEIKIRPYFDELRLCDITPKEVMRWQNQMLDGKKKEW
ncbi:Arm DNA-binding domain-containing protein [Holdemanella sp. SCCA2]|nr:Arm DNA-binding domain-containing protein [Holdemanella sp. SCCA2]